MIAQGVLAQVERSGNYFVRRALMANHRRDDLTLRGSQRGMRRSLGVRALSAECIEQLAQRPPVEPRLAGVHAGDGLEDHLSALGFVQYAASTGQHRALVHLDVARSGKDENLRIRADLRNEVEPAFLTEIQIEQHNVRCVLFHRGQGIARAGYAVRHSHLWTGGLDQSAEPPQHAVVVIDEENADGSRGAHYATWCRGSSTATTVRPPVPRRTLTRPPSSVARSPIERG